MSILHNAKIIILIFPLSCICWLISLTKWKIKFCLASLLYSCHMQFFPDHLQLHSNSCSEFSHAVAWLGGHPTQSGFFTHACAIITECLHDDGPGILRSQSGFCSMVPLSLFIGFIRQWLVLIKWLCFNQYLREDCFDQCMFLCFLAEFVLTSQQDLKSLGACRALKMSNQTKEINILHFFQPCRVKSHS